MSYDAILFDLDGVLVSGRETSPEVYRDATAEMFRAFGDGQATEWSMDLENPDCGEAFREVVEGRGWEPRAAWGYRERAASEFGHAAIDRGERKAYADTDALAVLTGEYPLGIVSNNRHETVAFCLDTFGWMDLVDVYRGRFPMLADYDRMKPDPAYLEWTIERLGVDTPLFVGDRISDVVTANAVGCDSALLDREGTHRLDGVDPTYHIRSLGDLIELHESGWPP